MSMQEFVQLCEWIEIKKKLNYKIILITGCAGFIGVNLTIKLLEDINNCIICADNLIVSTDNYIKQIISTSQDRCKFILWNVCEYNELLNINEIYHLASIASPDKYKKYSIETIMVNFIGTKNMLDLAVKNKCKILFTSTSEIYGDPLIHPQSEEYWGNVNTVGERSCYDESKRLGETIIYEYKKIYNVDAKIVRIFNTYGPYMDLNDGRVITNFLKNFIDNKPIKIYGTGEQTRSFCYIDDMIDGLIKMMNSEESGPINLGNPECEFTLNELAKIYEKIFEMNIEIIYSDSTQDDPKCRKPVIKKAIEKLNWIPKINLEEGLKKLIEFWL